MGGPSEPPLLTLGEEPSTPEGAGLRFTELVWEMSWLRLGKVSPRAAACTGDNRGQGWGDNGTAGLVGVIRGGRGVSGLGGGLKVGDDSMSNLCNKL